MTPRTLLYRHVNQSWMQQGVPSSQTFRPTLKDKGKLSVYDGDIIVSAEAAYEHWTRDLRLGSVGVLAVTEAECSRLNLPAVTDGVPFPAHATIDFTNCPSTEIKRLSVRLKQHSLERGWQYRPDQRD